jgi:putative CocE/NonD family hydrolase
MLTAIRFLAVAGLAAASLLAQTQTQPQPPSPEMLRREYMLASYTKYEHMIPMRDGVRLFTVVYVPKDESKTYPFLIQRTCYSVAPYGPDSYYQYGANLEPFYKEGFIFVHQDVRGRNRSEGEFVNDRPYIPVKRGPKDVDESSDAYDTIDWLVKHAPNNNGRAGVWGISYPGFYAAMAAIDAHPALKAASPQAPIGDWFMGDDWRHNGALFLAHAYDFFSSFGRPYAAPGAMPPPALAPFQKGTPDGYDYFLGLGPLRNIDPALFQTQAGFWRELLEHETYDAYWKARNLRPHVKNIKPALLTVGGWFDAEDLLGPLAVYRAAAAQGAPAGNRLVMGPWSHGGWMSDGDRLGNARFASKTGAFFRERIMLAFFAHHLKGKPDPKLPEAYVFETGRNQWRKHDAWPPRAAASRTLYFHADGKLAFDAPAAAGFDEYVSDPNRPVPATDEIASGMTYNYMTADQRFASRRPDVLVYRTEPLESDVTLAGPIDCTLFVSTTGTDSDFIVKLVDGFPGSAPDPDPNPTNLRMGGYEQLIRGEPMRGAFREGFERTVPFEPGKPARVAFQMPDVYHTFRRGHRIIVHVQSTWFPMVARNPQKLVRLVDATAADYQKATQRVYRSAQQASSIAVRVLN